MFTNVHRYQPASVNTTVPERNNSTILCSNWFQLSQTKQRRGSTPEDAHTLTPLPTPTQAKHINHCLIIQCSFASLAAGSVNGGNCAELAKEEDIDGFLVGGASLKVLPPPLSIRPPRSLVHAIRNGIQRRVSLPIYCVLTLSLLA